MRRVILGAAGMLSVVALVSCAKKAHDYDTHVTLKGTEVVSWDEENKPRIIEVTVEYPDCPGEQLETLQGNAEFTACALKYKVGDVLPAVIEWGPTDYGHYDSEIAKLGDCARQRDPRDARSYEVVQVCSDIMINGVKAGFHCDRKPNKELLEKCPWFAR
jgi:hypothetical protein